MGATAGEQDHVDVLIIGAGISGIGAACYLQRDHPQRSYTILEARGASGGTWDLFRFPGVRSDSDLHTFGYEFRPWRSDVAIADGDSILAYLRETAAEYGIDRNIRYDEGHAPDFAGRERFGGPVVHPQRWPEDLDYSGKRVVVIGSGATAVTVVPELAKRAAHVTMLQRSPTYIMSRPARDAIADWLRAHLPANAAYQLTRWKNVLLGMAFFTYSRKFPAHAKRFIIDQTAKLAGDSTPA